jgi:hypothetical protein
MPGPNGVLTEDEKKKAAEAPKASPENLGGSSPIIMGTQLFGGDAVAEVTREEIDAKLEAVEARMDARVARIESQVERTLDSVNHAMNRVAGDVQLIQQDNRETRSMVSNSKWWAIGTGVAVLLGIWQIVTGITQSNTALFESGRVTGAAQSTSAAKGDLSLQAPQSAPATKRGP